VFVRLMHIMLHLSFCFVLSLILCRPIDSSHDGMRRFRVKLLSYSALGGSLEIEATLRSQNHDIKVKIQQVMMPSFFFNRLALP
jgi:hypothetical protein